MISESSFQELLRQKSSGFHPVVQFGKEKVAPIDLSSANPRFTADTYNDFEVFNKFIEEEMSRAGTKFLHGGYKEDRAMYRRSSLFDGAEEPRSLHLGIDIWGDAGVPVYAPLEGLVHSFAYNNNHGDYGATIILQHHAGHEKFFLLYGHLALKDLENLRPGHEVEKGEAFAHIGPPEENGNWPPHLHFQLIREMGQWSGDYPGVCKPSEAGAYLGNSPDPAIFFADVKLT